MGLLQKSPHGDFSFKDIRYCPQADLIKLVDFGLSSIVENAKHPYPTDDFRHLG